MEILFLILKIIGVLLAVCVLLLVAAVAVPVRYRVRAEFYKEASGFAVFSWLLHIIDFRVRYEERGVIIRLRIFGIPIKSTGKEPLHGELSNGEKEDEELSDGEKEDEELSDGEKEDEELSDGEKVVGESSEETDILPVETGISDESTDDGIAESTNKKDKNSRKDRRKTHTRRKQRGGFRWMRRRREQFSGSTKGAGNAKEKFQNIKNMISDETNKSAVRKIWRIVRYLVRHLSPRKVSGELAFGMSDPARIGQILGVLSMIPFWARYKINIYPDFQTEHFYVEGKLQMRGHIRLWHFILSVIRLFIDKELRLVWRRIRK